jgi:hypothetical protein
MHYIVFSLLAMGIRDRRDNNFSVPSLPTFFSTASRPVFLFIFRSLPPVSDGDIHVDNGIYNRRINQWMLNATSVSIAMPVLDLCFCLVVDLADRIYCLLVHFHEVVRQSSISYSSIITIVAGIGTNVNTSDSLSSSRDILVITQYYLYVADSQNNRIQLFPSGELQAVTVAGTGAPGTITLSCPAAVVLDHDGYFSFTDN